MTKCWNSVTGRRHWSTHCRRHCSSHDRCHSIQFDTDYLQHHQTPVCHRDGSSVHKYIVVQHFISLHLAMTGYVSHANDKITLYSYYTNCTAIASFLVSWNVLVVTINFVVNLHNNNNNNQICKAPECQKTSVALHHTIHIRSSSVLRNESKSTLYRGQTNCRIQHTIDNKVVCRLLLYVTCYFSAFCQLLISDMMTTTRAKSTVKLRQLPHLPVIRQRSTKISVKRSQYQSTKQEKVFGMTCIRPVTACARYSRATMRAMGQQPNLQTPKLLTSVAYCRVNTKQPVCFYLTQVVTSESHRLMNNFYQVFGVAQFPLTHSPLHTCDFHTKQLRCHF